VISTLLLLLLAVTPAALTGCTSDETKQRPDASPLYVALGASDSVGTGARNPAADGWVAQLHAKMPAGTRLANLGIGGLQTHQALEQVLPVAVDLQPAVVTVWLAVTDFAAGVPLESYRADLDTLLSALARETASRIYVANIPDLTVLPAFRAQPPDLLRAELIRWNEAIAASVAANGAVLVDLFGGWAELRSRPDYISRDGLHPSTAGHRRIAELFWSAMRSPGNQQPSSLPKRSRTAARGGGRGRPVHSG
jgi:lysophospholipase L1-like esterase